MRSFGRFITIGRRELIGFDMVFLKDVRFYKKPLCICLILCMTGLIAGCMQADQTPISEDVSMVGIDYQHKEYMVTLQLTGRSAALGSRQKPKYYQGKGQTVGGALQAAELKCGSKLIWDELKVVAVGKQAAVHNADGSLLALGAKAEIDPKTLVAVVEPSAELLVKGNRSAKGIDASKVELRLLEGMRKQMSPESRMAGIVRAAEEKNGSSLISYVVVSESSDLSMELGGSGVFYQNTLFALLDTRLTAAVLNIQDKPRQMDMQMVGSKLDLLSGLIKKSRVKLVPVMNDGKLSFIVSLSFDEGNSLVPEGDTELKAKQVEEDISITMQSSQDEKSVSSLKLTACTL